ncbi:hypothetical protein GCM10010413_18800 [Promicromonospora sukumoe]|uniref:Lipoprotein n=1 Tax=Promicromonospora sukumoe TaxID=88382 RepID=A0A7W3PEM2_9MICO|nr:hypothetical protein [Promicromonospora sukumoe]MBA8808901.1 hypothetical protein [Promicromonospora sukumoe]
MSVRHAILAVCTVLALAVTAGCTVRIGDGDDDGGAELFGEGNSMEWDLTQPLEAEGLGLPADQMVIVKVPDDATVSLTLPTGTWSGRTEEMTVTTRHGFVDQVDLFWTEADGQAAADRMVADSALLGLDAERVAAWAERARWAETADVNRTRHKDNYNGANGEVSTSVRPSMAIGEGEGTPVRLWYKFYVRDVVETAA